MTRVTHLDWRNFSMLVSRVFTRKCQQTKPPAIVSPHISTAIMRPDLNWATLVSEIWDVFAIWSRCSNNSLWPSPSEVWFWWLMMANQNVLQRKAQKKLMTTFSISCRICLLTWNSRNDKITILMSSVSPGKILMACQWMYLSSRMLNNSLTFSSTGSKLLSNQLPSDMLLRMSMEERYATWQYAQTAK